MVQGNQNQESIRFLIVSDGSKLWTEEETMIEERIINSRNGHVFIKKNAQLRSRGNLSADQAVETAYCPFLRTVAGGWNLFFTAHRKDILFMEPR